jgi:hypothetical protein
MEDVLHANDNNPAKAREVLRGMTSEFQQQLAREKEDKVRELHQQFQTLTREDVVKTLEANGWDIEAAIIPLFTKHEEVMNALMLNKQKKREEELKKQPKPDETNPFTSVIKINTNVQEEKESPFKSALAASQMSLQKAATLAASPAIVDVGKPITVEWEITNGKSSSYDWVGLFAADQPNRNYVTYEWRGKEETKGTITFTAPSTFGIYEFRYIPAGSYEHIAISNQIKVGPHVELTAHLDKESKKVSVKWEKKSGNSYPRAWVGLYESSEINNKNYLAWQYTAEPYTEASFTAPIKPGGILEYPTQLIYFLDYEFRFFPYSYNETARSRSVTVEGHDTLEASVGEDNTVKAKVSVVTVDPYYDKVWIGLYLKSETNNKNLKRYAYISERETEVSFRAPEAGEYEFRLFAKKSYNTILASNPIVVPGTELF